jgi:hypothetical protein
LKEMKQIRQLAIAIALILSIISLPAQAQSSKKESIEKLEDMFSIAYTSDDLGTLDVKRPYWGKVRIVIEYPLADPKDRYESKVFKTFGKFGRWLKSREREDGTPFRETRPLVGCKRGLCTYDFNGGIDHNHLYLDKISSAYRNGHPYIKTIFLLAG